MKTKKSILIGLLTLLPIFVHSQDKVILKSGDTLHVNISKSTPTSIEFNYPSEEIITVENKSNIKKIIYKSGRNEIIAQVINNDEVLLNVPANLFKGVESIGGQLEITNDRLIFTAHSYNVQSYQKTTVYINQIKTIEKKLNGIKIYLKSGFTHLFVVNNKDKIIKLIEERITQN